jgi:hypothetical protein
MDEKNKPKDEALEAKPEVAEEEYEELVLSPERNKVFARGFWYLIGLLVLAYPIYLLAKLVNYTTFLPTALSAMILYCLAFLPSFKIWKSTQKEIKKHEDYAYDGKLKFSFYLGMLGTTALVTLAFVGIFTGALYAIKPNPFSKNVAYINGKSISLEDFQDLSVDSNPFVRASQLKSAFGKVSYRNLLKVNRYFIYRGLTTKSKIKKEYLKSYSVGTKPDKAALYQMINNFFITHSLYLESKKAMKKDAPLKSLIDRAVNFDMVQYISRLYDHENTYVKQDKIKPTAADFSFVPDIEKYRQELSYKRIMVYAQGPGAAMEAAARKKILEVQAALKGGMSWSDAIKKFTPTRNNPAGSDRTYKANKTADYLLSFFDKANGFISDPVKVQTGYMIIKVLGVKNVSDKELLKNPGILNRIKSAYLKKFTEELAKKLEDTYRSKVKLNIALLMANKESNENFLTIGDDFSFSVKFFWKNLSDPDKEMFSNPANKAKLELYLEEKYIKPSFSYLEAVKKGMLKNDFIRLLKEKVVYERTYRSYVLWDLGPRIADDKVKNVDMAEVERFYTSNPYRFMRLTQTQRLMMRYGRAPEVTPFNKLTPAKKTEIVSGFKRFKWNDIVSGYVKDTLIKKYKMKIIKSFFKDARSPRSPRAPGNQ